MAADNHRTEDNHRIVPGQPPWCTECWDYCGGGHPRCEGCGGKGTAAQEEVQTPKSQIQPDRNPPATRTAESPDAPAGKPGPADGSGDALL